MKHILLSFFLLSFCYIFATPYDLRGVVTDSITGEKIELAQIRIERNGRMLAYALTDAEGFFQVSNITEDEVDVWVSAIGYNSSKKIVSLITDESVNMGEVKLSLAESQHLSGVTVLAPIVRKPDRTIYQMTSDILKNTVNALDVFCKIPEVKVNQLYQTVALRGDGATLILLNGVVTDKTEVNLKTINPKDIEKIELIYHSGTNVNSDYLHVINIILKEHYESAFAFTPDINWLFPNKRGEVYLNFTYTKNKSRFSALYGFNQWHMDNRYETERKNNFNELILKENSGKEKPYFEQSHRIDFLWDYRMNKKNLFHFSVRNDIGYQQTQTINEILVQDKDSIIESMESRSLYQPSHYVGNYTLYYKHSFAKEGAQLSVNLNASLTTSDYKTNFTDIYYKNGERDTSTRKRRDEGFRNSYTLRIDYEHPFQNKSRWSIGGMGYYQIFNNRYHQENENINVLHQNIRANLYTDYSFSLWNSYWKLGFKWETYYFNESGQNKTYFAYLPNFYWSKPWNSVHSLRLSYSSGVGYPSVWQIYPYKIIDLYNISEGDPFLRPSTWHRVFFGYSFNKKNLYFSSGIYARKLFHTIYGLADIDSNNIRYSKIANADGIWQNGFTVSVSGSFWEELFMFGLDVNLYGEQLRSSPTHGKAFNFTYSITPEIQLNLPLQFYIMASATLMGKRMTYYGYVNPLAYIDQIAVGRIFYKGLFRLTMGYYNPFYNMKEESLSYYANGSQKFISKGDYQGFYIRFSANFGKGDLQKMEKIDLIRESDIK